MQTVLKFWFEQLGPKDWFNKSDAVDQLMNDQFLSLHAQVAACEKWHWRDQPQGRLAEILVLDSPFVGNAQWDALQTSFNADCVEIDCTFPANADPDVLRQGLERIRPGRAAHATAERELAPDPCAKEKEPDPYCKKNANTAYLIRKGEAN